ncbi:hypothetical protein BKA70DRAFT_1366498 [Coprinopsis sp. MPI-PUGE-AT-0042]|nr:hypothetical protein BKA70DRAFT_1366498 [Coprinopsis sp. MPI-PUGE-AT-0042]
MDTLQPPAETGNGSAPHSSYSSPRTQVPVTRVVAIIKNHALHHRFEIERRIQEASFEIVKERQMEFDTETDPETLEEIFGEDAHSLAEGPVWVYILERRRAVEVWRTLMGPSDPETGKEEAPNSLRALYGIHAGQNGLMGSPDNETAEVQIAALFASSPPFPTTDLPPAGDDGLTTSALEALQQEHFHTDEGYAQSNGYAPSSVTNPSTVNRSASKLNANGRVPFRARPLPASLSKPDIAPRMTKASALRAGKPIEKTTAAPRKPVSTERSAETFANVPGHKRSQTISVASTAAPTIAPRMTKAASLRLGKPVAPVVKRSATTDDVAKKPTFEGVPGHKRRETISVASIKPPTLAPRLNKSSELRTQKDQPAPPTSFRGSAPTLARRASSSGSLSVPKPPSRPASQTSSRPSLAPSASAPTVRPAPRASSVAGTRPRPSSVAASRKTDEPSRNGDQAPAAPGKPRPRPSSIGAPTIAPKMNKSAALRAAKMEAEAQAAAAAIAKKKGGSMRIKAAPPSSFKVIAT